MKIDRMYKLEDGQFGKLKAFFDLRTEEGIVIKGFKVVEGVNGLFVGFPSQKDKENDENGQPVYRDTVFMERITRDKLNDLAMDEYNNPSSTNTPPANTQEGSSSEPVQVDEVATSSKEGVQPFDDNDVPF